LLRLGLKDYIIFPAYGVRLSDKINIMFFCILHSLSFILGTWGKILFKHWLKRIPKILVQLPFGIFICRKGTDDILHVRPNYEMYLREWFSSIKSGTFIDIGAHIGFYTCMVGQQIKGAIIAIEADPNNYASLRKHVKINNRQVLTYVLNYAAYHENRPVRLFISSESPAQHSLIKGSGHTIIVEGRTLDSIVDELIQTRGSLPTPYSVKIDVEGSEISVLKGASNILRQTSKILVEVSPGTLLFVKKILQDAGFRKLKILKYPLREIDHFYIIGYREAQDAEIL